MSLVDLLTDDHEEQQKTRRVYGVAVGIVVDNDDPEDLGRVKVKFPWLSEGSEEIESDWAKVMSFMAGKERGAVFLPEVEDEVLVAFEHGDINFPYVIGALWNTEDTPPEKNEDGKNNIRKIRSRSGHEIIFDDNGSDRKERMEIHSNAGHKIVLDDSAGKQKISIKDKTESNYVEIDSVKNTITVDSTMKVMIKAQIIQIEASASIDIKSSGIIKIQGTMVKIN